MTAETFLAAKNSPHLEALRKRGIEVLLLADRVDEWVVSNLPEYEGKPLVSVAKGALDLSKIEDGDEAEKDKKEHEEKSVELKDVIRQIKETLGERVKDVRTTDRLTSSPACLVADEHDLSGNLSRILKSAGQKVPGSKPILEINPAHPLVQRLKADAGKEGSRFADWSHLLFDQAQLAEGAQLEDPAGFVKRMNELLLDLAGEGTKIWTPG